MKDFDLRKFRKQNNISQQELAQYLGVRQGFISQMERGTRPVSHKAYEKIMSNPDWTYTEASFEIKGDSIQQNGGTNNIGKVTGDAEILALRKEVELLRAQVADLKEEKAAYWEMIRALTKVQ